MKHLLILTLLICGGCEYKNCGYIVRNIVCRGIDGIDCSYDCVPVKYTLPNGIIIEDSANVFQIGDTIYFTRKSTK
jgi:hypothetical protein